MSARGVMLRATVFLLGAICFGSVLLASDRNVASKNVSCERAQFRYLLYLPSRSAKPVPALLVLHGAGDQPEPMLEAWKPLARKQGIALIVPELPRVAAFEALAPRVFRCMVEDAKQALPLDPSRIYVFGHSMGGYLAYDAALLQSTYFAAAAVHGMGISPEYYGILDRAERKTPVAIYVGDSEDPVLFEKARRTRELLLQRGFVVRFRELRDHDHNYYALADEINEDAWNFLKDKTLPPPSH